MATVSGNGNYMAVIATDDRVELPFAYSSRSSLTEYGWLLFQNAVGWATTR
ncbi:MAG: hypothetical protein R2705_10760 [Ilumatobacteraceae bacterium]